MTQLPASGCSSVASRATAMPTTPRGCPAGGVLLRQAAQATDEQQGAEVGHGTAASGPPAVITPPRAWNIPSMRWVTAKPPNMLMLASRIARKPRKPAVALVLRELEHAADEDDAADGVGDAHQRGVQRRRDVPDDLPADDAGQHEDRELLQEVRRRVARERQHASTPTEHQRRPTPGPALRGGARGGGGFAAAGGATATGLGSGGGAGQRSSPPPAPCAAQDGVRRGRSTTSSAAQLGEQRSTLRANSGWRGPPCAA
jgi:hypothetical protein